MTSLETRYRRLLALYPRDHRREYEQEMLAVLLADGRTGPGQTFDLLRSALGAHLRPGLLDLRGAAWRRTARAVQIFGALLLLGVAARRAAMSVVAFLAHPQWQPVVAAPVDLVRVCAWLVVVAAGLLGVRWLAVAAATAGVAAEIAAPARYYLETPAQVLNVYWIILAAVVVLTACVVSPRAAAVPRGTRPMVSACLALIASGTPLAGRGGLGFMERSWLPGVFSPGALMFLLLAVALAAIGVYRQEPPIRRRAVACAVPVLAAFPLVKVGFGGLITYNGLHPEATVLLSPLRWAVLAVVPVAAFAVAAELNRRLERSRLGA